MRCHFRSRWPAFIIHHSAFIILLLLAGCGPGNPLGRLPVSGSITLDGQAVESGNIRFIPQQSDGVSGGAVIAGGEYRMDKRQGLPPGRYQVQIFSGAAPAASPEQIGNTSSFPPPALERIPARYNIASTLTIEVLPGGPETYDFQLKSKE